MLPNPHIGPAWLHGVLAREDEDSRWLAPFLDTEEVPDNLYGQLRLNEVEVQVINTPEFQRLRYISQLAFAKAAFHTAEHSRFAHSLGACHVAKILVDRLNTNLAATVRDAPERELKYWQAIASRGKPTRKVDEIVPLYRCGEIVTWTERVIVGLAGLLHDLPHCPYSHDIEGGIPAVVPKHDDYKRNPAFAIMLFDTTRSTLAQVLAYYSNHFYELMRNDPQWGECDRLGMYEDPKRRKSMLAESLFELFVFESQQDLAKNFVTVHKPAWPTLIEDSDTTLNWWVSKSGTWQGNELAAPPTAPTNDWFQPYRHDLIGNTICADLVDYLARDATNAGVPLALDFKFLSRLSLNLYGDGSHRDLRIVFDLRDTKRGSIRYDVLHELFDYLRERFKIRERVTSHRVTHEGAAILKRAVTLLSFRPDGTPYDTPMLTLEQLHTDYRCNSDDALLRYIATSDGEFAVRVDAQSGKPMPIGAGAWRQSDGGPPLSARRRAASLAMRLIERRYLRPLGFLTSQQAYDRIVDFARAFEPQKGTQSDFVVRNVWAIENQILKTLGADVDGEISDKAIVYVLKPRGGRKDAEMLIATRGEFRDVEVLPLKNATGKSENDGGSRPPKLVGVEEAKALLDADYLTLWRIFLLVEPELLVDQEGRPELAAAEFHRWIRGWRFVRESGEDVALPPDQVAAMLSDRDSWRENARMLAKASSEGKEEQWVSDITNGINIRQLTFEPGERHRCRDVRHAFPLNPRNVEPPVDSHSVVAMTEDEDVEAYDGSHTLVLRPEEVVAGQLFKKMSATLSNAHASYDEVEYEDALEHADSILRIKPVDIASSRLHAEAHLLRGQSLLRLRRRAEALIDFSAARVLASGTASQPLLAKVEAELELADLARQIERFLAPTPDRSFERKIEDMNEAESLSLRSSPLLGYLGDVLCSRADLRMSRKEFDESVADYFSALQCFKRVHDRVRANHVRTSWFFSSWKKLSRDERLKVSIDVDEHMGKFHPDVQAATIQIRKQALSTSINRRHEKETLAAWQVWSAEARRHTRPVEEEV